LAHSKSLDDSLKQLEKLGDWASSFLEKICRKYPNAFSRDEQEIASFTENFPRNFKDVKERSKDLQKKIRGLQLEIENMERRGEKKERDGMGLGTIRP